MHRAQPAATPACQFRVVSQPLQTRSVAAHADMQGYDSPKVLQIVSGLRDEGLQANGWLSGLLGKAAPVCSNAKGNDSTPAPIALHARLKAEAQADTPLSSK